MADLQELFARLKGGSATPANAPLDIWAQPQQPQQQPQPPYQPPSVSSPLFSPPILTPNPQHPSNVISPVNPASAVGTPAPDQERTSNLLNLLRFSGGNIHQASAPQAGPMANLQNVSAGRSSSMNAAQSSATLPLSAQDLFASVRERSTGSGVLPSPLASAGAEKPAPSSSGNEKDFLLNLLKKPNEQSKVVPSIEPVGRSVSQETEKQETAVDRLAKSFAETARKPSSREPTPVRQFGTTASREGTPFEAPQPAKSNKFTYINPFDELHSSSPLNRTPKPETQAQKQPEAKKIEILKHNRDTSGANGDSAVAPAAKSRKTEDTASPAPAPTAEAEIKKESVSEALEEVGEKVDKQVENALAQAEKKESPATASTKSPEAKKEPTDDDVESSWESAEDSANDKSQYTVKVFNLPMKPFVAITIKPTDPAQPVRPDNFMSIAKLKKEFDQIDRNLVTASQSYIVYGQIGTKQGKHGLRIIRQDSGVHKEVFKNSGERIFNVQLCGSADAGNDVESVLGTGVNGSVFWTSLAKSGSEYFDEDDVESQGFVMPAVPTPEENTSNSPVKTRAKTSSRHPSYFAISRSKMIYIIAPEIVKDTPYINQATRKVNTEKYLEEHGLKINTGKAGKDFTFSEDDTVIASLDKSGVIKFWDIRELTEKANDITAGPHDPIELTKPIWSINASASGSKSDEKPSVSSVMLLDKDRAHTKGIATRYVLIGFKQNHILQLWDLGLGKAIQELRLPHEKDSDGICSISYHAKTGIIAVGHPTRNSVYFLHLSAPKYNVPHMDQARYMTMLAKHDPAFPKPDSTAIVSGLRELSFAKVGQLRSLDMLKSPVENAAEKGTVDETLFEMYVSHSKGIFAMGIKRADLGWDVQSKMVDPVDATKAGLIDVADLTFAPPKTATAQAELGSESAGQPAGTPSKKKENKKQETAKAAGAPAPKKIEARPKEPSPAPKAVNGTQMPAQASVDKASMQVPEAPKPSTQKPVNPPLVTPASYAMAAQSVKSPKREPAVPRAGESAHQDASLNPAIAATRDIGQSQPTTSASHPRSASDVDLNTQFDRLYQRLEADKRVSDAAGAAKQDAMLRLVSSTLTENVEASLHKIISASIENSVIPAMSDSTAKLIDAKLEKSLPQQVSVSVQREVKASLPNAIQSALRDPQVQRVVAETTANQVAQKVQQQVAGLLQQSLPNMATQATSSMVSDLEARTQQQLRQAEAQRVQDNERIGLLMTMVRDLSETLETVASSQASLVQQIRELQAERAQHQPVPSSTSTTASGSVAKTAIQQKSPEEEEIDKITQLLVDREFERATMEWLQSPNQASLFDDLFVRVNPQYLSSVSPLVRLSVSAALTSSFDTKVDERLAWLETVLHQLDMRDPDIADVAPRIMDVLVQRLQGAYMQVSESRAPRKDAVMGKISAVYRQVHEIKRITG
ncbi:hypothetical protein EJ03DRAFT_300418 [Teratosphaeria nubilosa]|uniref:EDC4-like protein pdc1 beta-propeller domain-containing protein n=1 Tax=Teratosphaeria nubilosa TaxID=161662 RepID=A0A6G1KYB9_9PEZI|nr:hypothetical protein EJ03DRAFT_300418 [Teratosphaeria nubilosa]